MWAPWSGTVRQCERSRALKGPACYIGAVLAATDFVLPGIEVTGSR